MSRLIRGALAGALAAAAHSAAAQTYPLLVGEVELAVQFDHAYDADTGGEAHLSDLYADSEASLALHLSPAWSVQTGLVLEPVRGLTDDRAFDDQGLYVEQLFLNYDGGWFSLYAGKFNLGFGLAWDRAPGVYGTDFAEDYEVTEQVGFGGALKLETLAHGEHEIGAAVYFADTSFLSNSAITRPRFGDADTGRPRRLRERNGGPGNTESLESYVVSLDGGAFPYLPNATYHLSHLRREAGATETDDEKGYAAALQVALDLGGGATLTPLVEVAWFDDLGGQPQDATYVTWGAELAFAPWSLSFSQTMRRLDEADDGSGPLGGDARDRLTQASVGYDFENGLGLAAGVKHERVQGVDTSFVGFVVSYDLDFQIGGRRN